MENLVEELKKFRFRKAIEKRWSDVDEMHHVNNAVYLTYFEQSRVFYFQEVCEWNWQDEGVILANAHVDYVRPLRYPDPAYIYVRCARIGNKSFELQYLIVNEWPNCQELVTKGYTTLVMFDYKKQASFPIPDKIRNKLTAYEPSL